MKKYIRIIGIVLLIALIAVLIWFGNVTDMSVNQKNTFSDANSRQND